MSNPTTVAEWKAAAANIQAQIKQNNAEILTLQSVRANLVRQQETLARQRDAFPFGSPSWLNVQNQILGIGDQLVRIDNDISEIVRENVNFTTEYNNALEQAGTADTGTPDTNTNTPPASNQPGDPTEVENPPLETPVSDTVVRAEDGTIAKGVEINPETGDVFYTDDEEPVLEGGLEEPPIVDEEDTEFGNLDQAIAGQEGLQEPPVLSDEEVNDYLNNQGEPEVESISPNPSVPKGLTGPKKDTQAEASKQDEANFKQKEDWRVRLSLAPESNYLYNLPGNQGILAPLAATDGIIFPYTPAISVAYAANYDASDIAHSNYKMYQYKNSSVDNISITCEFTAQDTFEANYLLAVIHFLRSVTKMWYGQDQNPKPGHPPPLCYLSGLGSFQFDAHPLAITNFTYNLPTDVDYIRAGTTTTNSGVNKSPSQSPVNTNNASLDRLKGEIGPGGTVLPPKFTNVPGGTIEPTYVPTKMQIQISAVPIISRNDISNRFSLREYGLGKLLQGSKNKRAGVW